MKYLRSYINLPAVLGILCGAVGLLALASTLAQNMAFGESLAETSRGAVFLGANSLIMDGFAATLAMVVGAFFSWRRPRVAIVLCVPLALYTVYSMQSIFGFGMTERLAKAERVRTEAGEARSSVERENAEVIRQRAELRDNLVVRIKEANDIAGDRQQPETRRREARDERRRLNEALTLLANAPPALKRLPPAPEAVLADPQADIVARWVGTKPETIAAIQIAAISVGLPLAKVLGLMLSSWLFTLAAIRGRVRLSELATKPKEAPAAAASDLMPTLAAPPAAEDLGAEIEEAMDAAVAAANDDVIPMVSTVDEDAVVSSVDALIDEQQRQVNDIQAYLAMATDVAPTVQVSARQFLNHYRLWARVSGRETTISNPIVLGNLLRAAGLGRIGHGNKVYYVGRSLRLLHDDVADGEVGLAIAA